MNDNAAAGTATADPDITDTTETRDEIVELGFRTEHLKNGFVAYETLGDRRVPETGDGFKTTPELVAAVRAEVKKSGIPAEALDDGAAEIERVIGEADEKIIDVDEEEAETELTEDARGNTYLPGTGPVVDPQPAAAAGKEYAAKTEWKDAAKKWNDAKAELTAAAHTKESLFKPDPDNTNARIYHAGGIKIRLRSETKEKVETEIEEAETE